MEHANIPGTSLREALINAAMRSFAA